MLLSSGSSCLPRSTSPLHISPTASSLQGSGGQLDPCRLEHLILTARHFPDLQLQLSLEKSWSFCNAFKYLVWEKEQAYIWASPQCFKHILSALFSIVASDLITWKHRPINSKKKSTFGSVRVDFVERIPLYLVIDIVLPEWFHYRFTMLSVFGVKVVWELSSPSPLVLSCNYSLNSNYIDRLWHFLNMIAIFNTL